MSFPLRSSFELPVAPHLLTPRFCSGERLFLSLRRRNHLGACLDHENLDFFSLFTFKKCFTIVCRVPLDGPLRQQALLVIS